MSCSLLTATNYRAVKHGVSNGVPQSEELLLSGVSCGLDGSVVPRISPIVRSHVAPSTHAAASRGVWLPQHSMAKQHQRHECRPGR